MPGGSSYSGGGGRRNNRGRWTRQEHEQFLGGLEAVGEVWCLVATYVPTRTELQIRTHAQKYFQKVRQGLPFPEEPYQSATESDGGYNDNAGAPAHIDGGAAAAAAGGRGPGPRASLPPAAASHHGALAMAPPSDGFGGDQGRASIDGDVQDGGNFAPLFAPVPSAAAASPAAHPDAACLAHNLDGVWLHGGAAARGAHGFVGEQHVQQQQQQQQQFPPGWAYGADMAGGGFSPPHGEAAPFRNWPVADDALHSNQLLQHVIGDIGTPNDGDGDDDDDGYAALAADAYRLL